MALVNPPCTETSHSVIASFIVFLSISGQDTNPLKKIVAKQSPKNNSSLTSFSFVSKLGDKIQIEIVTPGEAEVEVVLTPTME